METLQPTKQNDIAPNNNYKVSKDKHTTDENKNNPIHSQSKIHKEHLKNINKIENHKKLNMAEHKTDMNITKIDKYKKLNSTYMTEHKTDINITEIDKYKKTEQHFYNGTQNRTQPHFGEPYSKHIQVQQKSNTPQNSPRKRLTKIFN